MSLVNSRRIAAALLVVGCSIGKLNAADILGNSAHHEAFLVVTGPNVTSLKVTPQGRNLSVGGITPEVVYVYMRDVMQESMLHVWAAPLGKDKMIVFQYNGIFLIDGAKVFYAKNGGSNSALVWTACTTEELRNTDVSRPGRRCGDKPYFNEGWADIGENKKILELWMDDELTVQKPRLAKYTAPAAMGHPARPFIDPTYISKEVLPRLPAEEGAALLLRMEEFSLLREMAHSGPLRGFESALVDSPQLSVASSADLPHSDPELAASLKVNDLEAIRASVTRNLQGSVPFESNPFGDIMPDGTVVFGYLGYGEMSLFLIDGGDVYWTKSLGLPFRRAGNGTLPPPALLAAFEKWREGFVNDLRNVTISGATDVSGKNLDEPQVFQSTYKLDSLGPLLAPAWTAGFKILPPVLPQKKWTPASGAEQGDEPPATAAGVKFDVERGCVKAQEDDESCGWMPTMPYLSAKNGHWRAALLAEAADMPDEFNDRADVVSLPGSWVVGTSSRLFRVSKEGHQVEQINMPAPDARRSLLSMNVDEDPVAFILSNDGIESGWRPHPYSVMRVRLYEYDGFNNPVDRGCFAFDTASGDFAYVRGQRVKRRAGAYYLVSHAGMTPKEQPLVACADEARRENALGHNLYLQGNLEGALKLFDKAVQYDTAYRTAIFNLICTRSRLERPLGNDDLHWLDALFSDPNEAGKYKAKLIKDPDLGYWRRYPVFIDAINGWHPAKY